MQYIMENNIFYNKQKFSHLFFDLENKQDNVIDVIGINKRKCEIENEIENLKKPKIIEELHYRSNDDDEEEESENGNAEDENEDEDENKENEIEEFDGNDDDDYYYDDPMDIDDPYDEPYDEREDYECNLGYEDECYECLDIF